MQVKHTLKPVELYTDSFMINGDLNIVGEINTFFNDKTNITLLLSDVKIQALAPHAAINAVNAKEMIVNKSVIQMILVGDFTRDDARVLPKKIPMVCFTDTYVVRGAFRGGTEARLQDFFDYGGPFYAVTDFDVYSIRPLKEEVRGQGEILFLNRSYISAVASGEHL